MTQTTFVDSPGMWRRVDQARAYWAKNPTIGLRTINAKAETITAPSFREAIKYRRCLVPADAFYEWVGFEGAWAQKWAQRNIRVAPSRAENLRQGSCVGALFS